MVQSIFAMLSSAVHLRFGKLSWSQQEVLVDALLAYPTLVGLCMELRRTEYRSLPTEEA